MRRKTREKTSVLERKLNRAFLFLSSVVILLSLSITLYYDMNRQHRDIDTMIGGTAAYIASMPEVVSMLDHGYPDSQVTQLLDTLCATVQGVDVAMVCDKNGLRFYYTDRTKTGETYVDGDQNGVLTGSDPYITTGFGTWGPQRQAFHAVLDSEGMPVGFVMVSLFTAYITQRQRTILLAYCLVLAIMLPVSYFLSRAFLRGFRTRMMGFRPEELLHSYLRQDEVLGAVEEGLVATRADGTILFANPAAQRLLEQKESLVGRRLTQVCAHTCFEQVLRDGQPKHHQSWVIGGRTVMANEVPVQVEGEIKSVLTVLFDQTEMLHMSDELFGVHSMLDALRSFNHEHSNKMHVILGYLETGQIQKAIHFIVSSSKVSGSQICQTADLIRVSELCALIIGKMMYAAELGIVLTLAPNSSCVERDLLLSVHEMITVVGNLLENAIEELASGEGEVKEIKLGIYCRGDCNILVCEDTGRGLSPQIQARIFEQGISTKGEHRGMGLPLVMRIVNAHHGKIQVETEPGEGACFTITLTREEDVSCIE